MKRLIITLLILNSSILFGQVGKTFIGKNIPAVKKGTPIRYIFDNQSQGTVNILFSCIFEIFQKDSSLKVVFWTTESVKNIEANATDSLINALISLENDFDSNEKRYHGRVSHWATEIKCGKQAKKMKCLPSQLERVLNLIQPNLYTSMWKE